MAANSEHIIGLLEKYSAKQASSAEVEELFSLLRSGDYDETVVSFIEHQLQTFEPADADDIAFWQNRLQGGAQRITGANQRPVHRVHFLRKWGWAAAAIVIGLGIGVYFWNASIKEPAQPPVVVKPTAVPYGKNGAVLVLADGREVVLDSLGDGIIADQNGMKVALKGGALSYDATGSANGKVGRNEVATPYGRQFQVTLPDGTKAWLNAASSISYPTVFTGKEREVYIRGEVYFEVAKNAAMPFVININIPWSEHTDEGSTRIEVLGTHFNVKQYRVFEIETTLLEGSLKVVNGGSEGMKKLGIKGKSVILKPGEQSVANGVEQLTVNHAADLDKVMAWKNGLFNFEGASFWEVKQELERWYDVEIVYEKEEPKIEFEGKLTRDVPLTDLLRMFEKSDIHFRKEGRKLIILSGK